MLDLSKIVKLPFPETQYYRETTAKKQITLHHTASGRGIDGDFTHWINDPARIATGFIVDFQGVVNQCFASAYWGHHLGVKSVVFAKHGLRENNLALNKASIAIEIDAWGPIKHHGGKFFCYTGKEVAKERVVTLDAAYRGHLHYERYTDEQIRSVEDLILFFRDKYGIDVCYNSAMWDVSKDALMGKPGVWSHTSYRPDKSDIFPQPELIQMLQGL